MEAFKGDGGLSWADQWDYKFNDKERVEAEKRDKKKNRSPFGGGGGGDGLSSKIKDKAKVAALAGAQKIKSGTSSGVQWIKDKYQKQKAKKAGP